MRCNAMLGPSMAVLLSGCATSGGGGYGRIAGTDTVDTLELQAPKSSGKTYYL